MSISDLQIDTSLVPSKNSGLMLQALRDKEPFTRLVEFIEKAIQPQHISIYGVDDNVRHLNRLCASIYGTSPNSPPIVFSDQQLFDQDNRYYEQIIFETKHVPTRPNWHDFFNGMIWCQFPHTKQYFNHYHMTEIASQQSTNRTVARDRLTHFDECGIVLFTTQKQMITQLQNHQWNELFVKNAASWHQQTLPVIFGHALWEMLLEPFVGLTAKATVIEVSVEEMTNMQSIIDTIEFYATCDKMLCEHIKNKQLIKTKKPWLPLPLLGIPHWSPFPQTQLFYGNQQYFMPKKFVRTIEQG